MNTDTLSRIVAAAEEHGLAAVIAASPANFTYLTGVSMPSRRRPGWHHPMLAITPDGGAALFALDSEAPVLAGPLGRLPLTTWTEHSDEAMDMLAGMLWDMSLSSSRIGIETDFVAARDLVALSAALPRAEFVAAEAMFAAARAVKTPRELALVARAARIAGESVASALNSCHIGVPEFRIASSLAQAVYSRGIDGCPEMTVASGPPGRMSAPVPGPRELAPGDLCHVEVCPEIAGYHGMVRRHVQLPPAPDRERRAAAIGEGLNGLAGLIRPGASGLDVYRSYARLMAPLQLPRRTPIAHGIGLALSEEPVLSGARDVELREGMVLVLEPPIAGADGGIELSRKDMIEITADGARLLTVADGAAALVSPRS
jgi:Xaa-Pro aminopeptidase